MPLISSLILDPVARYQIYGTFPWKLLIHICIVIVSSAYSFDKHSIDQTILNPQIKVFYWQFLNTDMSEYNVFAGEYAKDHSFYTV